MRKAAVTTGAIAALSLYLAGHAAAADLGAGAFTAPPPYGAYTWYGPYLGLNLGYQWGSATNSPANPSGFAGGLGAGYNWQSGNFVYGLETDLDLTSANDTFAGYQFSNPWFGTARGRAGLAMNNILFFATLGIAYGGGRVEFSGLSESHWHFGWTAGAGMEVKLTPNWSIKAEYLYLDLSQENYGLTGASNGFQDNLLRFGVNYHF
ncbi:MAG TPA: outer membrane protein [Xanthobacteraceae bacterium]|jgi:outer membrane immunogenic protein|nr:outer membrane protein [Xanthobacteraceae bacterium]